MHCVRASQSLRRGPVAVLPAPEPPAHVARSFCALLPRAPPPLSLLTPPPHPLRAQDAYFYSGQAVRCFGIGIVALVVLVETEWQRFLALVPLLDAWLGRGVLQACAAGGFDMCFAHSRL